MLLVEIRCRWRGWRAPGAGAWGFKLLVQSIQLTAEHLLIVALLPLQSADLHDPAFHDGGALAAALDEVIRALLVLRDRKK